MVRVSRLGRCLLMTSLVAIVLATAGCTRSDTQEARSQAVLAAERRGEYLTVWKKQRDGTWQVIFDTGSTLPAAAVR